MQWLLGRAVFFGAGGHHGFASGGGNWNGAKCFSGAKSWSGNIGHGWSFAYSGRSHVYASRSFDRSGPNMGHSLRHGRSFAMDNDHGNWKGHNHHHFDQHHHRFINNNLFVYGGNYGYYGYNDCYWLRRQAIITGSPYWWSRYEAYASEY